MVTVERPGVEEVARLFKAVFRPDRRPPGRKLRDVEFDLTMAQLRALRVLSHEQPLAIGALGERLGVGLPAASRLVERLVGDGFAERYEDPADRRRALVRPTVRGQSAIEAMQEGRGEGQRRLLELLARLPEPKLAALREGLEALAAEAARDA